MNRDEGLTIGDYDPTWPERFSTLAARVNNLVGDLVSRIEHIGSTAIPGLPAKPVIDINRRSSRKLSEAKDGLSDPTA
jgi:GrpB-like predicted nucleotidyltransferase (UPF0157 family)